MLRVHEMMFGTREAFDYVQCSSCKTLQIKEIPHDLSRFYPGDYYSFSDGASPVPPSFYVRLLRRLRAEHVLNGSRNPLGVAVTKWKGIPDYLQWLQRAGVRTGSSLLDVGCGRGHLLRELSYSGFTDLRGVDPFLPADQFVGRGVLLEAKSVHEIDGQFDCLLLNHSFEHVPDPVSLLETLRRLLKPGGTMILRVPLASSKAFTEYGADWVQLDAPRHLYLLTPAAIESLARRAHFSVSRVDFDSTGFQFWGSEQYRKGIPLFSEASHLKTGNVFNQSELTAFADKANEANAQAQGDQASFYLS